MMWPRNETSFNQNSHLLSFAYNWFSLSFCNTKWICSNPNHPNQKSQLIVWKVHVREHGYHDSLHSAEVAQLYPQVGDSITHRWLRVSILPIIHFLRCTTRRSTHSFSQHFPARKTSTPRFHHCGSHILQKPPLVPRLGLHHTFLLPQTSAKLEK
jgi:hypothetical protein